MRKTKSPLRTPGRHTFAERRRHTNRNTCLPQKWQTFESRFTSHPRAAFGLIITRVICADKLSTETIGLEVTKVSACPHSFWTRILARHHTIFHPRARDTFTTFKKILTDCANLRATSLERSGNLGLLTTSFDAKSTIFTSRRRTTCGAFAGRGTDFGRCRACTIQTGRLSAFAIDTVAVPQTCVTT